MMAGNPNWWSMNGIGMHPQLPSQFIYGASASISAGDNHRHHHHNRSSDDYPVRSWSDLLLGGEERFGANLFQQQKKVDNWEDQSMNNLSPSFSRVHDVKQEYVHQIQSTCNLYDQDDEFLTVRSSTFWPHNIPLSSPTSNSFFNFSHAKSAGKKQPRQLNQEHSSECNSGVSKKARCQQSSAQPALKVRKEKLGDRITALHQMVSPYGKTDTASVLSEAIGYIRFLHTQIEALSSPYMRNGPSTTLHHQHSDSERRGAKDLRSRGLCLVPISCTQHVGSDGGSGSIDYWAPAAFGGSSY